MTRHDLLVQLAQQYRQAVDLGGTLEQRFGQSVERFSITARELRTIKRMAFGQDDYSALDTSDLTRGGKRVLHSY